MSTGPVPITAQAPQSQPPVNSPAATPAHGTDAATAAMIAMVDAALQARGLPPGGGASLDATIKKAAGIVPSWVIYGGVLFGGPSVLAFFATAQAVMKLPEEVAKLSEQNAAMLAILKQHGVVLKEQEIVLAKLGGPSPTYALPTSYPTFRPFQPASGPASMPNLIIP